MLPEPDDVEEASPLKECLHAVKELLLPPGVDPEANMGPAPMDENGEPLETLQMKYLAKREQIDRAALEQLLQLFDPLMGAAVAHDGLGDWLAMLLSPECQELPPLPVKE